jgi:hypothetical protein
VQVDDRIDAAALEQVDRGIGRAQIRLVVRARSRLDPRPREQEAHRIPADRRDPLGVPLGEGERGREFRARPVLDESVDVHAAEQDLAAFGVDDPPAGERIGLGVQRRQAQRGGRCAALSRVGAPR